MSGGSNARERSVDLREEEQVAALRQSIATAFNAGDPDLPSNQVRVLVCPWWRDKVIGLASRSKLALPIICTRGCLLDFLFGRASWVLLWPTCMPYVGLLVRKTLLLTLFVCVEQLFWRAVFCAFILAVLYCAWLWTGCFAPRRASPCQQVRW